MEFIWFYFRDSVNHFVRFHDFCVGDIVYFPHQGNLLEVDSMISVRVFLVRPGFCFHTGLNFRTIFIKPRHRRLPREHHHYDQSNILLL